MFFICAPLDKKDLHNIHCMFNQNAGIFGSSELVSQFFLCPWLEFHAILKLRCSSQWGKFVQNTFWFSLVHDSKLKLCFLMYNQRPRPCIFKLASWNIKLSMSLLIYYHHSLQNASSSSWLSLQIFNLKLLWNRWRWIFWLAKQQFWGQILSMTAEKVWTLLWI
jgi:hypothetical protein